MENQTPELKLIWDTKVHKDNHHILFFRRVWREKTWSRRLREHPYVEVMIPSKTLHPYIHKAMDDGIPCPNEFACEMMWHDLEDLRLMGLIDPKRDDIEQRLNTIIELFSYCREDVDGTVKALLTQKYIVRKFYQASR